MITHPSVYLDVLNYERIWVQRESLTLYPHDQIGDDIRSVKEYSAIRFRFESSNPNDELLVETYDTDGFQIVKPGCALVVNVNGDSDDMLVPGDYPVRVQIEGCAYETLYRIQPKTMTWDQLLNLRKYLEMKMSGLAYNVLERRSGSIGSERDLLPHALKVYQQIRKQMNKLHYQLEDIMKNPAKDVVQEYAQRSFSRKPDSKSQRWLTKRASAKNSNPMVPSYFYEKHAKLTEDTAENRWIKYVIRYTKKELKKAQLMFELNRSEQKSRMAKKMKDLGDYRTRFNRITSQYGFDARRKELQALINQSERELANAQDMLRVIDDHLIEVNKYIGQFSRYEQTESMVKTTHQFNQPKPTQRMLKDKRYAWLYRFYKGLKSMETNQTSSKSTFPYKKTSLLFEYYVLCLVIDILLEDDLSWSSGWLADYANPEMAIGSLVPETLLRFDSPRGDYYVELAYDTQIAVHADESISHFKANIKRAPDIRISVYQSSGEFMSTIILDAKYRRYAYLWNDLEETDVTKQLNDYLRIWHYDVQKPVRSRMKRDAVSKVVAVYPQQNEVDPYFEKMDKTLAFVQITPVDPAGDEEPFGYQALRELIVEFLKNATEDLEMKVI